MRYWIGTAVAVLAGLLLGYFRVLGREVAEPVVSPDLDFRHRPPLDPVAETARDEAEFQREWDHAAQLRAALWAQAQTDPAAAHRLRLLLLDDLTRDTTTRPIFAADVAARRMDANVLRDLDAHVADTRDKLATLDRLVEGTSALPPEGGPAA